MCSQRTLIASPPFAPTILCQILQILLISLKSVNRPISSVTSHHVTLRTGGQASVCLQHGGESDYEAWVVTRLF